MAKGGDSKRWLKEHRDDGFVKSARVAGYRSRAAYKLMEIDGRDRLLAPGLTVVDLGAAPGGWTQVAVERTQPDGCVVALDLRPMTPLPGATVIEGDFSAQETLDALLERLGDRAVGLVMSDMAPNMSGIDVVDQARAMHLAQLSLDLAKRVLGEQGALLVKVFHGDGFDDFCRELKACFERLSTRKPRASRARSRETYLLARGYRQ
ncbi:MAG: 23S rRNA methyltransferase [Gammaproteobacteria bacterium]|nr:MAG: 23S rRNA methyltransferase [Gammaproteobacteria bacterium]